MRSNKDVHLEKRCKKSVKKKNPTKMDILQVADKKKIIIIIHIIVVDIIISG